MGTQPESLIENSKAQQQMFDAQSGVTLVYDLQTGYKHPSILVLEDDPLQIMMWQAILSKFKSKIEVIWTDTEESAEVEFKRKLLRNQYFDLVIADIMLPGVHNGMELWNKFGEQTETPFIFATGIAATELKNLNKSIECSPFFLKKPFEPREALRAVESLLAFPRAEVTLRRAR